MGSCASGKKENGIALAKLSNKLHESEVHVLSLIYDDLANRSKYEKITTDTFRLFFHKTGFWGDRLFREFEGDKLGFLGKVQFLNGIAEIFKSPEDSKIMLLFAFFSHSNSYQLNGLTFQQFLQVLYNYPKTDLKAIMDDQQFLDHNIRRIVNEKQKHITSSMLNQTSQMRPNTVVEYQVHQQTQMESSQRSGSVGMTTVQEIIRGRSPSMTNMKKDGEEIHIKTSSINSLTRKFARTIFRSYNVDENSGKLSYKQFRDWIKQHKNLYNNYFEGFHSDVWEYDELRGEPKYLSIKADKKSIALIKTPSMKKHKVVVTLLQDTLIIATEEEVLPQIVINLEGLKVRPIQHSKDGQYGITILHNNEYYEEKIIYFSTKAEQDEWFHELRFYKGYTVAEKYLIKESIGSGKFSVVHRCEDRQTSKEYAMKIIDTSSSDPYFRNKQKLIQHESTIMEMLQGVNTVIQFRQKISTKNKTYIITQLVEGKDLYDLVRDERPDEETVKNIARQIIITVRAIHEKGIIHRDLKPQNIMINGTGDKAQIKIIDFGLSAYQYTVKENKGFFAQYDRQAGSPGYFAPESLESPTVSEKADNFAIGGIIYFMLTSTSPFHGKNLTEIFNKTVRGDLYFDEKKWKRISMYGRQIVEGLMNVNPNKRMTLNEALKHAWFRRKNSF